MGFTGLPVGSPGSTLQLGGPGLALIRSVPFSAAATVSVDGCFTSAYENYCITVDIASGSTTAIEVSARLRLAGSDSAVSYTRVRTLALSNNSTSVDAAPSAPTGFVVGYSTTSASFSSGGRFDILSPALARYTRCVGMFTLNDGSLYYLASTGQVHSVSTAYDGLSIVTSTGNITGTLSIYGYRKA